jgi:lipopolysaccharide transport system ATP-binding protein
LLLRSGRLAANGPVDEVVQQYLATGLSLGGEMVWSEPGTAPGNGFARLQAVRVRHTDSAGSTADIGISQEIEIEIVYRNFVKDSPLTVGFTLRDHVATTVFVSSSMKPMSLTPDTWGGRPHPVGTFRSVCHIPAHFLNEGRYAITPFVGEGLAEPYARAEDALSFNIHDTGEMRGEYFGHWPGVVRPWLPWSTEQVG